MRVKLVLATLLHILPCNIYGSEEVKKSNLETENLIENEFSDGMFLVIDEKKGGPAVKTAAEELTDNKDYAENPVCGDKQMIYGYSCYCGNKTLSGTIYLRDGDYYCCVPPSGEEQCK